MSCNCPKANPLALCADTLIIGEVDPSEDYYVIFKTPTGRIDVYEGFFVYGTSQIAITDFSLRADTQYEVWLTLVSADNYNERTEFAIGETDIECFIIEFQQAFDTDNANLVFETQTVTLEEDEA